MGNNILIRNVNFCLASLFMGSNKNSVTISKVDAKCIFLNYSNTIDRMTMNKRVVLIFSLYTLKTISVIIESIFGNILNY